MLHSCTASTQHKLVCLLENKRVRTPLGHDAANKGAAHTTLPDGKAVCQLANMSECSLPLLAAQVMCRRLHGNKVVHTGLLAQQVRIFQI